MAKNLKLNIKNTQLAKALTIKTLQEKPAPAEEKQTLTPPVKEVAPTGDALAEKRRVRARSRSAFAPLTPEEQESAALAEASAVLAEASAAEIAATAAQAAIWSEEELREAALRSASPKLKSDLLIEEPLDEVEARAEASSGHIGIAVAINHRPATPEPPPLPERPPAHAKPAPVKGRRWEEAKPVPHVPPPPPKEEARAPSRGGEVRGKERGRSEFRDVRPKPAGRSPGGEEEGWRRRRPRARHKAVEDVTIRPTQLKIRLPISIKDLAVSMKLKASQLVGKLFMQGAVMTLNDLLDDETVVQLLGHEFGCQIEIDTTEETRLKVTGETVDEEIAKTYAGELIIRAPVVTFMGHVDHGKTSLIDRIRRSNVAATEAGAITQHIGAFQCGTAVGPITILDTPGHEAFTAMRARGAHVTDVVVLVIAGDEGIRTQTVEAISHAKAAEVSILVAINKCDKPNFNAENVYRQLAELDLLPEAWGGSVITVNCSAATGEGVPELLEMIALQAEVLELKANPQARARGTVLESEMHKGLGAVATVLVQNGTLRHGDSFVFDHLYGRVKTMQDEFGKNLKEAGPATPVAITGLSGLPAAGSEFIVVENEKEAREIAEGRKIGVNQAHLQKKRPFTMEKFMEESVQTGQKQLNLILRADVQGSLEALKNSLSKISSDKARLEILFAGVGAVSESDVELAMASRAIIIGFHTQIESHAEALIKQSKVQVRLHDIIYHAIDDVRALLTGKLEKVAQERTVGAAEIRQVFRASQLGKIAGCHVSEGVIHRNNKVRLMRQGKVIWQGTISSLRRESEDVREVKSGFECGIVLDGRPDIEEGDRLEAFEIIYLSQEL